MWMPPLLIRNDGDMPLPRENRKNQIFSVIYLTDMVILLYIFKDPCDIGFSTDLPIMYNTNPLVLVSCRLG